MSLLATSSVSIINVDDGQAYALQPSNSVIIMEEDGSYKPSQLSFQSVKLKGTDNPSSYSGRFKIERTSDETNWTTEYTSSSDESSITYNMPSTIEEKTPYNFRVTGNENNVGSKAFDTIVGGTIAWNQLVQNGNFEDTSGWNVNASVSLSAESNVLTVTMNANATTSTYITNPSIKKSALNHVYMYGFSVKPSRQTKVWMSYSAKFGNTRGHVCSANHWADCAGVIKSLADNTGFSIYISDPATILQGDTLSFKNYNIFDLTAMFGSTIADYIYSLEQATAGAGVAWFRKLFPKDYYEYNAGELLSVSGLQSHDMVGFNQWDEEWELGYYTSSGIKARSNTNICCKNKIAVLPNTTYYCKIPYTNGLRIYALDYNGSVIADLSYKNNQTFTTPSGCSHIVFFTNGADNVTSYSGGICINLSWSGWRNGEYEAYQKHSYPLDDSLTLRGIPKLDAQNNLYYDGDTYESDGTVTRRYGIVDLGMLTWKVTTGSTSSIIRYYSTSKNNVIKPTSSNNTIANIECSKYKASSANGGYGGAETDCITVDNVATISVYPTATYADAAAFKTAMSGVYLVYELATPTTETAEPYVSPQIVDKYGTEKYVTDSIVPVGHETKYTSNISSIRCSLYASGGTTTLLDQQIIPVINDAESAVYMTKQIEEYRLSDSSTSITGSGDGYEWSDTMPSVPSGKYLWKRLKSYFSNGSIAYSDAVCDIVMSGLVFDVDRNSNAITSKVWESDITTKINEYDGSTGKSIRDRVTKTETDISGINTTISDIQTDVAGKADGSTVSTLTTKVNTISDTVDGHTQTIESNTSRIDDAEDEIESTKTIASQTADKFTWIVEDGASASSVTYTSNAVNAMAEQINLSGKVTFSAFNSALQSRITTAEGDASTAKSQAASAVGTANTASDNASSALSKVNNSIQSTTMHYLATSASSGVTTSTSGWSTNIQTITVDKPYLWTYQTVTKIGGGTYNTDPVISGVYGNTGGKGDKGDPGNAGVSVTKVEQLYRTSNSTTAPTAPTSKVESTSTAANTWTLAMPTYNSSYPYYYTCTQTTYSNGNYTWTTVARSQAIEDANKTANTANTNASNAVTTANTANGKADTAVSTANTASENATAAVGTANKANSTANTALNGIKAFVGTSSTAAGTAAKVVDCSDGTFAMTNGVIITVTFSNASTADAPTLNVKSLGAKAIYFDNAVTSSSNRFRWKAGSVITFQYNGTYWVVLNYENLEYFTSSTAAGTADKTNASITGTFALCRGTTINVYFSTANTANAPTLNVSATGAFPIYYKNAVTSASNKYLWDAGTTLTFTFNGSYWYVNDGRAGSAVDWISTNGSTVITASDIMKTWTGDATLATTTIDGGYIKTHTIETKHLATDAIMSNNYKANTSFVYSTTGTFLDLANGNITSPTFAVDNTNGTAYIDGTISARKLLVGAATMELSASVGTLNSSQGVLICNALDAASDYLIYDGESICIKTNNFSIDPAGNVTMTGKVNSASGSIGGWEISPKNLHYGSSIGSEGSVYLIPEGSMSYHTVGGSPEMSGWVITAGDSFGVTNNGSLYANDANITGTFTITDGGIGGMTIDSDSVYGTTAGMSSNQAKWAFWAGETNGKHGASDTNAVFKVGSNGKLYATNAEITGKITVQSGTIGGWKIDDDSLYYYTDDTVPQVGTANSVFLFPEGSSTKKSIGGSPSTTNGWVFTAGNGFGVTRSGSVYANNGKIGGVTMTGGNIYAYNNTGSGTTAIPSFSLTSGGVLAIGGNNGITVDEDGVLRIPAVRITGTLTANQIAAGAITASKLSVTIGGNNLLRNSHADKTGSSTPWIWSYGPNPPKSGDKLTFQVKGYFLGSSQQIVTFGVTQTISLVYNSTTGTYVGTFTLSVSSSSDTYFRFNPGSTSATCDWVKLEYGDMATPWSPSPDEAAGFDVDATAIHTAGVAVTSNADNSVALSSADFTRTINSVSRTGLRFAIGSNFGVTGTGKLYATDAILAGNIKATSGKIGGFTIQPNYISYGTIGQDASTFIGAINYGLSHDNATATVAGLTTSYWRFTCGSNFGVTGSGMYATGGKIGGFTIGKNTISSNTANGTSTVAFTISSLSNYSAVLIRQNSSYYTRIGLSEIEVVGGTGTTISAGTISTNEIQASGEIETTALGSGGTVKLHSGVDNGLFVQNRLTNGTNQEVRFILNNNSNAGIYDVTKGRWALVYNINNGSMASNSQISVSSDERIKKIHRHLNNDHKKLFMALDPIEFSFIDKPDEIHFGFGAQTTEISMRKLGFGSEYNLVSHPLNGEMDTYGRRDSYYMNYTEALMLSVPVVQDHEKEIAKLKTKIEELENKLSQLTQ